MKIINEKGQAVRHHQCCRSAGAGRCDRCRSGCRLQAVCQANQGGCVSAGLPDDDRPRTRCNAVPGKRGAAQQSGSKSLVNGNSYVNAQITDMKIDDYNQQVTTADGRIVTATDPEKKDLVFTITTKVSKGTPAPAIGTQEVRAGRTFIVKTNDFETTGNIDSVDIADN